MGRIVGQIAKWPREPQNLSRDSGNLRHARCALRGEAGDYVIPSNPYGELSGSSRAWREFSGGRRKLRVVSGCGRRGDRGRGILCPSAFSTATIGLPAGLGFRDVLAPLRLPSGGVKRTVDRYEDLIVGGDP